MPISLIHLKIIRLHHDSNMAGTLMDGPYTFHAGHARTRLLADQRMGLIIRSRCHRACLAFADMDTRA